MTKRVKESSTVAREQAHERKADKRQAIVEAALELFTGPGYEQTTIADVAGQAGVAVGTVYLYFKSKPELLFAVKGEWESALLEVLTQLDLAGIPFRQRGRPIVEAAFKLCAGRSDMVQLMGLLPQEVGGLNQHRDTRVEQAIQAFLDQGVAAGAFRPVDTRIAGALAYGMVEDALHRCYLGEQGQNAQLYIDTLVDALEHWILLPGSASSEN